MRVIFVCDYFASEKIGGAEYSMQTHIDSCPFEKVLVKSKEFNLSDFSKENDFFIIGNFAEQQVNTLFAMQEGFNYVVEECDYKYCQVRSSHKHEFLTKKKCECEKYIGWAICKFFLGAKHLFWKSIGQREIYYGLFPELSAVPSDIMGGVYSEADLDYILSLKNMPRAEQYLVLKTSSWIKGYPNALRYCRENGLQVKEISERPWRDAVREMAGCKGFVYLPNGYDPSCRMITEAKLLDLDIITSHLVQHTSEAWFNGTQEEMLEFLRGRDKIFWSRINGIIEGISARLVAGNNKVC